VINITRFVLALLLVLPVYAVCWATETDPYPDLPALIECRQDERAFNALTPWLADPLVAVSNGWHPLPQINLFMREYRLLAPINVFGYATEHIAFAGTAIMAVIDLPDPRVLAQKLTLEMAIDTPEKVIYGREVFSREAVESTSGQPMIESAVLNVSNVASHPGKTLVGCDYSVDFDDSADEADNSSVVIDESNN